MAIPARLALLCYFHAASAVLDPLDHGRQRRVRRRAPAAVSFTIGTRQHEVPLGASSRNILTIAIVVQVETSTYLVEPEQGGAPWMRSCRHAYPRAGGGGSSTPLLYQMLTRILSNAQHPAAILAKESRRCIYDATARSSASPTLASTVRISSAAPSGRRDHGSLSTIATRGQNASRLRTSQTLARAVLVLHDDGRCSR